MAILPGSGETSRSSHQMDYRYVRWCLGVVVISALLLIGQLFQLQVVQGARNQALADGNRIRQNVIRAPRGAIYDSKGVLLARNVANFDLVVIPARLPKKAPDRDALYAKLGAIITRPAADIKAVVEKDTLATPLPVLLQENVDREIALSIEEQITDLPGVDLDTNPVREYLDGGQLKPLPAIDRPILSVSWASNGLMKAIYAGIMGPSKRKSMRLANRLRS